MINQYMGVAPSTFQVVYLFWVPCKSAVQLFANLFHVPRHLGGAMLRETAELTSPEVAMVHRGERVLLLHQVVLGPFWVEKELGDFDGFSGFVPQKVGWFLEIWVGVVTGPPPPPVVFSSGNHQSDFVDSCAMKAGQGSHLHGIPLWIHSGTTVSVRGVYLRNLTKKM